MARKRKEKTAGDIKLAQPDRSAPSEDTLLQLAQERGLFDQAERDPRNKVKVTVIKEDDGAEGLSPTAERVMDTILWTISLAMLHFMLDVLVQHQYAVAIKWHEITVRTLQAFLSTSHHTQHHNWPFADSISDYSLHGPLLPAPSPLLEPDAPTRPPSAIPNPAPPSHISCDQRPLGVLPHLHHQQARLPRRNEAGANAGLLVGVVRDRARPRARSSESCRRRVIPLERRI
jgi:hypothetical protein